MPDEVIGLPDMLKTLGTVIATLVTEPDDPAFDASSFTVPVLFLKYSFSSTVLSANSPATRFPADGAADVVAE